MTHADFSDLVSKGTVLLDGGTGSNLIQAGLKFGNCTEAFVLEHPDIMEALQKGYIEAGSQIIYAPTFGANRGMLRKYGLEDQTVSMNQALFEISERASNGRVLIAGDIAPTGLRLSEYGGPDRSEEMFEIYREQALALYRSGCDLFVVESMMAVEDTVIAVQAIRSVCPLPIQASLSVRKDGQCYFSGNVFDGAKALEDAGVSAYGVNCCDGPEEVLPIIRKLRSRTSLPLVAKPNAGLPRKDSGGKLVYPYTPATFADRMKALTDAGAGIVGGCCGTSPDYIAKMKLVLNGHKLMEP